MKRGRRKPDFDPLACAQQIVENVLKKAYPSAEEVLQKGVRVDYVMKVDDGEKQTQRTALHMVAAAGDLEGIEWLAGKGALPNIPMEDGLTLLHYCVVNDQPAVLQKICDLAANGAFKSLDLCKKSPSDETPTQMAINQNKVELAKILLKAGSRHDFTLKRYPKQEGGEPFFTQFQHACAEGTVDLIETMFELERSPYEQDPEGDTLLHLAVKHKRWTTVDLLLAKGIAIDVNNSFGVNVLTAALRTSETPLEDATTLLQKGFDFNTVDDTEQPPLQSAIALRDEALVALCLDSGALITSQDRFGNCALHKAAKLEDATILQKISSCDEKKNGEVQVNAVNHRGETPLHVACAHDRPLGATHLLSLPGVCPNMQTSKGSTPLHITAQHGAVACMSVLLSRNIESKDDTPPPGKKPPPKGKKDAPPAEEVKKTDIEATDNTSNTALQVAMQHNQTEAVTLLIENKASVQRTSPDHGTLLHQSIKSGTYGITKSLVEGGASVHIRDAEDKAPVHIAVEMGCADTVRLLLEKGAQCDSQDEKEGKTPLHIAATKDCAEIAAMLLDGGASLEARDHKCLTALHHTAQHNAVTVMKLLVDRKADLDPPDLLSRTPLHSACDNKNTEATELLIASGADITLKDNNGWSPLHVTAFSGACACLKALIAAGAKINETDHKDRIPFLLATEACKVDAARLLVSTWKSQKACC